MYTIWPSAGSPAFKELQSLVLRCGIFLTLKLSLLLTGDKRFKGERAVLITLIGICAVS